MAVFPEASASASSAIRAYELYIRTIAKPCLPDEVVLLNNIVGPVLYPPESVFQDEGGRPPGLTRKIEEGKWKILLRT